MQETEIGQAKSGRHAYAFDDVAIVPSRRTRDPEECSVHWQIDAYRFELPIMAAPMDSVMSPQTAVAFGKHGGLGVLDLEGLWTRYDDPSDLLTEVAGLHGSQATSRLQEIYAEPIKPELITARLKEMRDSGVTVAGSLSPQRTKEFAKTVVDAGCDMFVIRGTTVSAEHVSEPGRAAEPQGVHLRARRARHRRWLCDVPGRAAPDAHRRRGSARRVRRRSGAHHAAGARHQRADGLSGRRRRGGPARLPRRVRWPLRARHRRRLHRPLRRHRQGRRLRRGRGDGRARRFARAKEAPGQGYHWGSEAWHPHLPRGERIEIGTVGTLEEILFGPSSVADGTMNLVGALRRAMATTGYTDLKEFQRVEVVVQHS